ncbi:MAG: hypothetical protein ACI8UO_000507 [Verrucomicrobiales bacterium]|jgi:hypothetical protein
MLQLKPARIPIWTFYVFIGALAVLAHRFVLSADFFMDDYPHILRHSGVIEGEWSSLKFRWLPYLLWSSATAGDPIAHPATLHALNLIVHIAIACLMLPIGRDFLRRGNWFDSDQTRTQAAALGAIIFAMHPLGTEPVHYTRCLMIDLVTLFSVLTAWFALRFSEKPNARWAIFAIAALIFATVSKKPGFAHAAANLAIVGFVCINWSALRKLRPSGKQILLAIPFALTGIAFAAYWIWWGIGYLGREQLLGTHALTQGRVFWIYIQQFFLPTELSSDHYVPWSMGLGDLPAVIGSLGVLVLVAGCIWMLFTKRFRILGAILALALAPLLLRFGYVVSELVVEYRVYPALPWFGLLAGCGLIWIVKWNRAAGLSAVAVILTGFFVLSNGRSALWTDSNLLAMDTLHAYPKNLRAITIAQQQAQLDSQYQLVKELAFETDRMLEENEAYNAENSDRQFEMKRVFKHWAIAHQYAIYAIALDEGVDPAIVYADRKIREMSDHAPWSITDENPLIMARLALVQFVALRDAQAEETPEDT